MEQHAENRMSHESLMTELIDGEKNGALAVVDFNVPEIPEALKTPDIMEAMKMLNHTQEVKIKNNKNYL